MPTSSQPAIGEVEALMNRYPDDEIINVAMAAGLSGTYNRLWQQPSSAAIATRSPW